MPASRTQPQTERGLGRTLDDLGLTRSSACRAVCPLDRYSPLAVPSLRPPFVPPVTTLLSTTLNDADFFRPPLQALARALDSSCPGSASDGVNAAARSAANQRQREPSGRGHEYAGRAGRRAQQVQLGHWLRGRPRPPLTASSSTTPSASSLPASRPPSPRCRSRRRSARSATSLRRQSRTAPARAHGALAGRPGAARPGRRAWSVPASRPCCSPSHWVEG